ncbi:MAG: hypothetical protein J5511_03310 [Bacilli bacterium]|nr:hypothetical protein [Bacilli bacterium]
MENTLDSKIIRCRYGSEDKVIKDYSCFGWTIASKTLLNRFGNPLPVDARISEDDKREKCSWELTFKRFVTPDKAQKLYLLENEYDSLTIANTSFGRGRITGAVFLTLASIVSFITYGSSFYRTTNEFEATTTLTTMFLIFGLAFAGGLAAVLVPGILRVSKAVKQNEETEKARKEILKKARKIIEEE